MSESSIIVVAISATLDKSLALLMMKAPVAK
jgi:hypothetical protein